MTIEFIKMVIRNKKIIGLISIVVGLAIFAYQGYYLSIVWSGKKTDAQVTGYVLHRNGAQKVQNPNKSSKRPFDGRSPFVKFKTENNETIETDSKTPQLFFFTGYQLGEAVKLYYNPNNPKQIFIVNDKEILGFIFIFSFGLLLLMMGKSFLFKKTKL